MRAPLLCSFTLAAASIAMLAGCSGSQSSMPQTMHAAPPASTAVIPFSEDARPDAKDLTVGVRLTGETSFDSPNYGVLQGYFKGTKSTTAQVVTLSANTNVVFQNVDKSLPHTASFLGDATKKSAPFPKSFTGSATAAPAGTDIGTTNFSTGPMNPGTKSAIYKTGAPGFYMFGCAFHYVSAGMRTVIIVK